jgi:3alpha(or 20beta)-hydroxysteroid dehydrogenase
MSELEGRVAIVTGAARGVGAAIAKRLVEAGAEVLLGDILHERGEATAKEIGKSATFLPLNVTNEADWARVVEHARASFGRVDVLVNDAAALHIGAIENTSPDVFRRLLEVNPLGPFLGTRAVLATMKEQGRGSIVHISSIDGLVGMNGLSAYASSKWGVRGLAKSSAQELGRSGIRVNTICPAGGNPEMFADYQDRMGAFPEDIEFYTTNRGIPGETPFEAIANAVLYLGSDASLHVTGIDLPVDGGATAGCFLAGFNTL